MSILRYVPFFIAVLSRLSLLSPTAGASTAEASWPDKICHNVTDYSFCIGIVNSEPVLRPTTAINIAYIAFKRAGDKSREVVGEVTAELEREKGSGNPRVKRGLENCLKCYNDAGTSVGMALGDMDLDEFNKLIKWSEYANNNVTSCYKGYRSSRAITKGNVYMMKVLEICHVISLQFLGIHDLLS